MDLPDNSDQAIVGLFLDDELSWERRQKFAKETYVDLIAINKLLQKKSVVRIKKIYTPLYTSTICIFSFWWFPQACWCFPGENDHG